MSLNPADSAFLDRVASRVGSGVLSEPEPRYLEEPRGRFAGQAGAVAKPRTAEEVAALVGLCNEASVPVVPYGGGTGLVGGQVKGEGVVPLVVSLERMRAIRDLFPEENVIIAEAGAVLEAVQAAAQEAGRLFPLSLAAQGSCQIGGNLATNAGGVNVLRYGNARDLCLGLEAVLPNGEIWHGLSRLRKDNTGYDLKNLLIGAEGSLGIITAASLKLFALPVGEGTALMAVPSVAAALDLLAITRDHVGEAVSAFELIHREGLEFLAETMPEVRQPFAEKPEWCVLIDLGLGAGQEPQSVLEEIFATALVRDLVLDGLIAQSETQRTEFWSVRESIPLANRKIGAILSNDISIPISRIAEFVVEGHAALGKLGPLRINAFGHLGDGNLHYNVYPPKGENRNDYNHLIDDVKDIVNGLVHKYNGSISAEHGIGRMKTGELERYGDPVKLVTMRAIKSALDPKGIMNPGVVLKA
ncbi:FAD-binding oxidoreductase [Cognatishimia activa]|uniref:FAD-binding oxidoreductase n=1 Tax=Cognatishimia activa TaxID=1715691 RepID=A0A975EPG3_9RHOB|nr:FAD-binding oxidoreductase [Cognatishimia activa]QTN35942.1 FAD-binding oxidoreductase [Cognatishimia activa]